MASERRNADDLGFGPGDIDVIRGEHLGLGASAPLTLHSNHNPQCSQEELYLVYVLRHTHQSLERN